MRHLLDKEHPIYGPYTVKAGRLSYRTQGSQHAHAPKHAHDTKREFKLSDLNQHRDFVGIKPVTWEIVLRARA